MDPTKEQLEKTVDIYRDTWVRFLGMCCLIGFWLPALNSLPGQSVDQMLASSELAKAANHSPQYLFIVKLPVQGRFITAWYNFEALKVCSAVSRFCFHTVM